MSRADGAQMDADGSHAKERARGPLVELVGRWLAGQAVFAAIVAFSELALSQKQGATIVAAAARGAVQGSSAGLIDKDVERNFPVMAQEMSLHVLGVKGLSQALELLRFNGEHALAKRLSRQSKARNGAAHPDVSLVSDLEAFMNKSKVFGGGHGVHGPSREASELHELSVGANVNSKIMKQKKSTRPDTFFIGDPSDGGALAASSYGWANCLESASQTSAHGSMDEHSPESVEMVEEVGAPIAAKAVGKWADMFSSDSSNDDCEETTAPQCKTAKADWLEAASQRECCEIRKLMKTFGSNGTQQEDVVSTFEWLPKPLLDIDTCTIHAALASARSMVGRAESCNSRSEDEQEMVTETEIVMNNLTEELGKRREGIEEEGWAAHRQDGSSPGHVDKGLDVVLQGFKAECA